MNNEKIIKMIYSYIYPIIKSNKFNFIEIKKKIKDYYNKIQKDHNIKLSNRFHYTFEEVPKNLVKNKNKIIFIHVPKTGGTTLLTLFNLYFYNARYNKNNKLIDKRFNLHDLDLFSTPIDLIKMYKLFEVFKLEDEGKFNNKLETWTACPQNSVSSLYFDNFKKIINLIEYNKFIHFHLYLPKFTTNTNLIFNKNNWKIINKNNIKIFTMIRDPINYLISFYNFIREAIENNRTTVVSKKIINLFKITNNFEEFIEQDFIHNGQCKYLLDKYLEEKINLKDTKIIYEAIDANILYFGITEKFNDSITYFNHILHSKILDKNKIIQTNISKIKYIEKKDLSKQLINKIKKKNQLDYKLLNYINIF